MEPSSIADNKVVALAIGSFAFLSILYVYRKTRPSAVFPPGPPQAPVVGNLFQMPKEQPWLKYAEWGEQYGDIVHVRVFNQHMIILNNYKDAARLMHEAKYSDRLQTVMLNELMEFGWGISPLPYGPLWRHYRKIIREQFTQHKAVHYNTQQEECTRMLLRDLLSTPDDFCAHVRQWAARIHVDIAYGIDIGSDTSYASLANRVAGYSSLGREPFRWLVDRFPLLKYVPDWMPGAQFKQVAKDARAACKQLLEEPFAEVEKRMAEGSARRSYVSNLITQLDKSDPTYKQTKQAIKHTAGAIYGAGADTTSATMESAILYMVLQPEAKKRAQAELDAVIGKNRLPVLGDRPELPYVTAFAMEVTRCFVTVPAGVSHLLNEMGHYKGFVFPKGSQVIPNAWAMLRDPRVYVDPEKFNPDRFLATKDHVPERDPGEVGVFGFGRRKCPGQYLTELSAWLGVASVLAAFDVSPALDDNGNPIDVRYALSGVNQVVDRPLPFPCSIKPRSEQVASLTSAN